MCVGVYNMSSFCVAWSTLSILWLFLWLEQDWEELQPWRVEEQPTCWCSSPWSCLFAPPPPPPHHCCGLSWSQSRPQRSRTADNDAAPPTSLNCLHHRWHGSESHPPVQVSECQHWGLKVEWYQQESNTIKFLISIWNGNIWKKMDCYLVNLWPSV